MNTDRPQRADRALKAKHRAMWALGDYPPSPPRSSADLGAVLVEACGVGPGDRVLDVAAGSGNAAIPAALAGASVVASDLTPELLEAGRAWPCGAARSSSGGRPTRRRCRTPTVSSTP